MVNLILNAILNVGLCFEMHQCVKLSIKIGLREFYLNKT
jgi:hypothetical protein